MHLLRRLALAAVVVASVGCGGGHLVVKEVNPMPSVVVSGGAGYAVDVSQIPDRIEAGPRVALFDVRRSVEAGFHNAVGSHYRPGGDGATRLVFDAFDAKLEPGRIVVLRVTYRARWIDEHGALIAETAGSAIAKNPLQVGSGHWRDSLEVMIEQLVNAYEKASRDRVAG